ncbi:hydrogenase maturation protease [Lyngbya confervoides]|uniref:Hydrogenase maturation protease n=1 Tax=Lyngbya confervoides BDU141951 TaxID=1574623 RepID=A0ABD4T0N2_9CYAN|nr:hydrogenase maturation protease [Lyngbya confervoides]MCM1982132.1 hydrogenase maturation protease [Lyngbya confervoides BDU141951]
MQTLVIGYGNTLRSDDGVGFWVAEQIAVRNWPQVRSLSLHQLLPELAADMAQADQVYFIDAWVGGSKPQLQQLAATPTTPTTDHGWTPESLMHLTKTLYGAEPLGYHLLIPAVQFDYGETQSAIAQAGMQWAIQTLESRFGPPSPLAVGAAQEVRHA